MALNTMFRITNLPYNKKNDCGKNITMKRKLILKSFHIGCSRKDLEEIESTWPLTYMIGWLHVKLHLLAIVFLRFFIGEVVWRSSTAHLKT